MKEKTDTVAKKVSSSQALSNVSTKLFAGTLTKSDFLLALNGANELTNEQLLLYARTAVSQFNSAISSAAAVKSTVPKMLNSPFFMELFIPGAVVQIQEEAKAFLADPESLTTFMGGAVVFEKLSETKVQGTIDVKTFVKKTFGILDESNLSNPSYIIPEDVKTQIRAENSFIDSNFNKYSTEFPAVLTPTVDTQNSKVLETYLLDLWPKFTSVFSKVLNNMPDAWINEMLADYKKENGIDLSLIQAEHMAGLKKGIAEVTARIKKMGLTALSAEAPDSTSAKTAYRKARSATGGVGLSQFTVDGNTLDQSYALDMPLRVNLKGSLTSGKRTDVVGSVTYNMNGTVVGVIQGYNNTVDLHAESSVMLSQSMGNFFIEGQAGFVGVREGQFSGWEGQRYQMTLGYDAANVSPFVQVEYRPLSNGFSTLDAAGVYAGLESDVLNVTLPEATFTSTVLAKVGYESVTETMFAQSLKPNQSTVAYVEWNAGLKLSEGLDVKSALTLGSKEQSVRLNVAFEQ